MRKKGKTGGRERGRKKDRKERRKERKERKGLISNWMPVPREGMPSPERCLGTPPHPRPSSVKSPCPRPLTPLFVCIAPVPDERLTICLFSTSTSRT